MADAEDPPMKKVELENFDNLPEEEKPAYRRFRTERVREGAKQPWTLIKNWRKMTDDAKRAFYVDDEADEEVVQDDAAANNAEDDAEDAQDDADGDNAQLVGARNGNSVRGGEQGVHAQPEVGADGNCAQGGAKGVNP
jgi:hypothetical protein